MNKIFLVIISLMLLITFQVNAEHPSMEIKRVYVNVCADLMHAGHVEFFKKSRELGNYLIVGVHTDADIASYKRVPILTLDERVTVVKACRYVDEVIEGAPLFVTEPWLKEHKIDVVAHGDDFNPETIHYWYGEAIDMGIFKTVPYTKGISTTDIINRIKERFEIK